MCLIVTDSPERCAGLLPAGTDWSHRAGDRLGGVARTLWTVLEAGTEAWIARAGGDLPPGAFWRSLVAIGSSPSSQFDLLHGLLRREPELGPVACLALEGRGFHGHRGRHWAAEAGNIHLSVGLPVDLDIVVLPRLIMLPAVAVVDAVRAVTRGKVTPGIKWVNDLLVDGRKIAGVLTTTQTRGRRVEAVTLGIGLNVDRAPVVEPTPFVPRTGALRHCDGGEAVRLHQVLRCLLDALGRRHRELLTGGGDDLYRAYRDASLVPGRRVRIWPEGQGERVAGGPWPAPLAAGRVLAIEPDLSLRIEECDEPVCGGRLAFESVCRDFPIEN